MAAGLVARNAVAKGLSVKPWVKTSLAPGSQVVAGISRSRRTAEAARQARLQHRRLRLHDLHRQFRPAGAGNFGDDLQAQSRRGGGALGQPQLRGPRQSGRARQLPRLAPAGRGLCARRLDAGRPRPSEPIGNDKQGKPVYLADIWPTTQEVARTRRDTIITPKCSRPNMPSVFDGDANWRKVKAPARPGLRLGHGLDLCPEPALFRGHDDDAEAGRGHRGRAHPRRSSSNSITTDHISPAGSIRRRARRANISPSIRCARPTSTSTARGAATTR